MSDDLAQLTPKLEAIIEDAARDHENKDNIMRNYSAFLKEVTNSDAKSYPRITEKWMNVIKEDKFHIISQDLNNCILNKLKPFFSSLPWGVYYQRLYRKINSIMEVAGRDENPYDFISNRENRLFSQNSYSYEKFMERNLGLRAIFDVSFRENLFIEVSMLEENNTQYLFSLLFSNFLISNIHFPQVISNFILDLLALQKFLTLQGTFNDRQFKYLNMYFNLISSFCNDSHDAADLWTDIDNHSLSLDIIWEFSKLINGIFLEILHRINTEFTDRITEGDPSAKTQTIEWLENPVRAASAKVLRTLFNLFVFTFELKKSSLIILDGKQPSKDQLQPRNFTIVLDTLIGKAPILIMDRPQAKKVQHLFNNIRFEQLRGLEDEDFSDEEESESFEDMIDIKRFTYQWSKRNQTFHFQRSHL